MMVLNLIVVSSLFLGAKAYERKTAGTWPDRFDANMSIAPSQPALSQLYVPLLARLRYDFPNRNQLWEYADLEGNPAGGELWRNYTMFSYDAEMSECWVTEFDFSIVTPTWLQTTVYTTTNYLLRQPVQGKDGDCSNDPGNYTISDLYKIPNTLGMTNSWLIADSPIAEPIRLEGPDDFDNPDSVSILEYATFESLEDNFDDVVFEVPEVCENPETRHTVSQISRRALRPHTRQGRGPWYSAGVVLNTMGTLPSMDSDMCCDGECDGDLNKYYSIDTRHNMCGECCMLDSDYHIYKIFERGLTKANSTAPCSDLGYPIYDSTETHGAGPIQMTLDLYDPENN